MTGQTFLLKFFKVPSKTWDSLHCEKPCNWSHFLSKLSKSHQKLDIVSTAKKHITGHTFSWKFFQVPSKTQVSLHSENTCNWAHIFVGIFLSPIKNWRQSALRKKCVTGHTFLSKLSKSHQKLKLVSTAKKRVTGQTFLWKFFKVPSKTWDSLHCEKPCNWSHFFVETFQVPSKT